jgi:hypothetical protein
MLGILFLYSQLTDGDEALQTGHTLLPRKIPEAIVQVEGLGKLKKKLTTSSGIEPATSQLVV